MMKAAATHRGVAPLTARSLTVPLTARSPTDPPGKCRGRTTNESVLKQILSPEASVNVAASGRAEGCPPGPKASRNTASTRAAEAFPPAPWAEVMKASVSRGRRLRAASTRARAASSPRPGLGLLTARLRP